MAGKFGGDISVLIGADTAQFQSALRRASREMTAFAGKTEATGSTIGKLGARASAAGAALTKGLTLPVVAIGVAATKMAIDFESSMELLRTQAGASQGEVNKMSKSILSMVQAGNSFGQSAMDMSRGLFFIESSGFRGAQAMQLLRASAAGAALGQTDLASTTDVLTTAMHDWHLSTRDSAKTMSELNAVVGLGKMHFDDLNAALSTKLPGLAAALGVSLKDVGAALDLLSRGGIKGSTAANMLVTPIIKLLAPSKAGIKALKDFGITSVELGTKLQRGGLTAALQDLSVKYEAAVKKMGAVRAKQDLFAAFGGTKGGAVILKMLQEMPGYLDVLGKAQKANSPADFWKLAAIAMGQPKEQIKRAIESVKASLISIGVTLAPVVAKIAQEIAKVVQWFDKLSASTKRKIEIGAGIAAAAGPVLSLVGAFSKLAPLAFALASPMGAIAAAVALLGGALVAAQYAPKQFAEVLEKLGLSAPTATRVINDLRMAFQDIKTVVQAVWPYVRTLVVDTLQYIEAAVRLFSDLLHGRWSKLWGDVVSLASAAFHLLTDTANRAMSQLWSAFENGVGKLAQAGADLFSGLWKGMKRGWQSITGWLTKIGSYIVQLIGNVGHLLYGVGRQIIQSLWDGMKSLWHSVTGWLSGLGGAISSLKGPPAKDAVLLYPHGRLIIGGLANGMKSAMGEVVNAIKQVVTGIVSPLDDPSVKAAIVTAGHTLGQSAAMGIARGFVQKQQSIADQIKQALSQAVHQAMQAARQAVQQDIASFVSAFDALANAAISAFDAIQAKWKSPASEALKKMQHDDTINRLNQSLQAAQQGLGAVGVNAPALNQMTDAQIQAQIDAATDPQVKAAWQAFYDAQRALEEQALVDQAQAQQDAHDKEVKAKKDQLEKELSALKAHLLKVHATAAQSAKAINALLKKYGLTPSSVQATTDWATAQALFSAGVSQVAIALDKLTTAIDHLAGITTPRTTTPPPYLGPHATGGPVGAGLALLHDGEYVLQARAAQALGGPMLDRLNRLPHYQDGGPYPPWLPKLGPGQKYNPITGVPDVPAYRAAAMYLNDGGRDKNETPILTALIGALGPRAQAQAAMRQTYTFEGIELRQGRWRAGDPYNITKMKPMWEKAYPGVVFETGTPGQQINWMQAASRLPMQGQELGSLIQQAFNSGSRSGSLLEHLTSHAVHFDRGGVALANGLAMLHKNEAIVPLPAGGGLGDQTVHVHLNIDSREVGSAVVGPLLRNTQLGRSGLARPVGYR